MEVILFIVGLGSVLGTYLFDYLMKYVSEINKINDLNSIAISNYTNYTNKSNQELIMQIVSNLEKTRWYYHIEVLGIGALVLCIIYAIYTIHLCIRDFYTICLIIYENLTNHPEQQPNERRVDDFR